MPRLLKITFLFLAGLAAFPAFAQDAAPAPEAAETPAPVAAPADNAPVATPREWDESTLDLFATLPIQEGGRVKPLDTFAQFTLLRLNGTRTYKDEENDVKLAALPWLLNCLFYPDVVADYRHFLVDNDEAVAAIGITTHETRRDRYSFNELSPGMHKLFELSQEYSAKEANDLTNVERQIVNLSENVMLFSQLRFFFEFARRPYSGTPETALGAALRAEEAAPLSLVLMRVPEVMVQLRERGATLSPDAINKEAEAIARMMDDLERVLAPTHLLALVPPASTEEAAWLSPADMAEAAFDFQNPDRAERNPLESLALMERLPKTVEQPEAFQEVLAAFHARVTDDAAKRGEYDKVPLEVTYYRLGLMSKSLALYVLAFVIVALSWLVPAGKWTRYITQAALAVPTGLLIAGIVLRCIIRERPPVSTLYETILFITACAVVVALIIELMNKQRIIIALAAVLGCVGMFLANRYEAKEGVDTMPALIAVLDTNFWLSTHVTTVTLGYAAGILSGAIAHIYVIGRLLRIRRDDRAFYKGITRMSYGVLCFGLLFAVVGTILGGIWANDSWGRFWGWDPKENGALLICLWALVLLHARMGGYIRDLGVNLGAIFMTIVVTFSWWGVNNLGVGLHSYGFTSGVWANLFIFWAFEAFVLLGGFILWITGDSRPQKTVKASAQTG